MKDKKVDRRVQRTRELLNKAFITLIAEMGYEAITVQNIIDRANLGRSTFYAHYESKEDLLLRSMEELVHNIIWPIKNTPKDAENVEGNSHILSIIPLFSHLQEQHVLYKQMVGKRGGEIVIKTIHSHLQKHVLERLEQLSSKEQPPAIPLPIIANHFAGAVLTLLTWWLDNDLPYPPERMNEMFQQLIMPSIWSVMESHAMP